MCIAGNKIFIIIYRRKVRLCMLLHIYIYQNWRREIFIILLKKYVEAVIKKKGAYSQENKNACKEDIRCICRRLVVMNRTATVTSASSEVLTCKA